MIWGFDNYANAEDAVVLDVRMPFEYSAGHLPGSINIPFNQLKKLETAVPEKNRAIFVYCMTGARSARAKKLLEVLGYTDVRDLGGMSGYEGQLVQ